MVARKIAALLRPYISADTKQRLKRTYSDFLTRIGYDEEQWVRIVRRREWHRFLAAQSSKSPNLLEISPAQHSIWRQYGAGSYTPVQWPDFDICRDRLSRRFDIILAEEVFEHLVDPVAAAENVRAMLAPGGVFLLSVPFLIKVHGPPNYGDFRRWTEEGLRQFLEARGFSNVETRAWGNRKAVIANLRDWTPFGWGRDLSDEPEFPVSVWAYART